jgi:hypothetical protein
MTAPLFCRGAYPLELRTPLTGANPPAASTLTAPLVRPCRWGIPTRGHLAAPPRRRHLPGLRRRRRRRRCDSLSPLTTPCWFHCGLVRQPISASSLRGMVVDERGCTPPARDGATGTSHQLSYSSILLLVRRLANRPLRLTSPPLGMRDCITSRRVRVTPPPQYEPVVRARPTLVGGACGGGGEGVTGARGARRGGAGWRPRGAQRRALPRGGRQVRAFVPNQSLGILIQIQGGVRAQ